MTVGKIDFKIIFVYVTQPLKNADFNYAWAFEKLL